MPRYGERIPWGPRPAPLPRAPGEETRFAGQVTEERSNHSGMLSVTDRRIIYEPSRAGTRAMSVPLTDVRLLQVVTPAFGNLKVLRVGDGRQVGAFWVSNGEEWLDRIREARDAVRHPSMEAPILPIPGQSPAEVGPLQAGMPPCPTCGTPYVRRPDGTMVCPKCGPPRSIRSD